MNKFRNNPQFRIWLSYLLLAVSVIFIYVAVQRFDIITGAISRAFQIIRPFLYGFIIAYLLNIPCNGIERFLNKNRDGFIKKHKRGISIFFTYITLFLIIYLSLSFLLPSAYRNSVEFISNISTFTDNIESLLNQINESKYVTFDVSIESFLQSEQYKALISYFSFENILSSLGKLMGISSYIFNALLAFISSIYILLELDSIKKYVNNIFEIFMSDKVYRVFMKYAASMNTYMKKYVFCTVIDCSIIMALTTISFIFLGSRYAILLGLMTGLLNIIPYFGSIIATIVAVIVIAFTQPNGLSAALITTVVLLVIQQFDGNYLRPKLYGDSFSISPLLVIVSITVGGALFGIEGMVIGIPVVTIIKNILDDILAYSKSLKNAGYSRLE